ncbi:LolA family protein [Azospirillum doebereinerae]|uniref:Outer membrane lipoprotein carrier protein LolA n=1 Tax=Azospirillum doebereinerae TaxID=92933 RepID=A0A3S0XP55_9PROT|nr:outer membrane lipoprotein carrier protein LolA [Azospirillum doebereinerae]MCG5243177.1 outer membrane lipoprotein carrier protein LolA [Azospirillum doebereinerae]RUQ73843.1 outer membrane lipoprotein carrier protein LolA [Azospirillum doebereinerae]
MTAVLRRLIATLFVTASLAGLAAAPSSVAAAPAAARLSAQDQTVVAQAEEYLNGIHTMQSKFVQVAPDGRQATGTFSLSRPGKMRLEYDKPIKDFVVADGSFIFYWDGEMRQQSSAPIGSTLADFILRKTVRLSGDVIITDVYRSPGVVEISLVESKEPGKGTLTLVFEDRPFQLRKWRVLDGQGLTTEVALLNPRTDVSFDSEMFYFKEPRSGSDFGRGN